MNLSNRATASSLIVHELVPRTRANGPGWRSAVWLQGCTLGCEGCFNPETWTRDGRRMAIDAVFDALCVPGIEGITVSGGEPLQQPEGLLRLLRRVRACTDLSILLFTGYAYRVVEKRYADVLACVDVLLAGPFDIRQRVARGLLGSANKTVHFLTGRYTAADLAQVPEAEVVITPDGDVILTGIAPLS